MLRSGFSIHPGRRSGNIPIGGTGKVGTTKRYGRDNAKLDVIEKAVEQLEVAMRCLFGRFSVVYHLLLLNMANIIRI